MTIDPIQRRRIGLTMLLLSLVFFAISAAAGVGTAIRRQSVASEMAATDQECENRVKLLGAANVSMAEDSLTARWTTLEGGYGTLSSASAAAMACPGWRMTQFCMGEGCQPSGVSLTMQRATGE